MKPPGDVVARPWQFVHYPSMQSIKSISDNCKQPAKLFYVKNLSHIMRFKADLKLLRRLNMKIHSSEDTSSLRHYPRGSYKGGLTSRSNQSRRDTSTARAISNTFKLYDAVCRQPSPKAPAREFSNNLERQAAPLPKPIRLMKKILRRVFGFVRN